jgi:hypothetical protein
MLEFRNIGHAYNGTPSVNDISLTVNEGEVVTLLGHRDVARPPCCVLPPDLNARWPAKSGSMAGKCQVPG